MLPSGEPPDQTAPRETVDGPPEDEHTMRPMGHGPESAGGAAGYLRELVTFARRHKALWLTPLVLVVLALVLLLSTNYASAPFHYTVM